MSGTWQEFEWRDRAARAWLPDPLTSRSFTFGEGTVRAAEQATSALAQTDGLLPTNWEPLARLLLRTEGIASSSIEGVRAPLVDVAVAELSGTGATAGWIADNLGAVSDALSVPERLSVPEPLTITTLHSWHARLMRHSTFEPTMIGAFRTAPSWIGGTSPLDAVFVPPPADAIASLMRDLIAYANRDHLDPVTQAALLHAQFETIHPYGDGNGRLGRILIGWLLKRRGVVGKLPPPISVLIARDPGGYLSGLHLFREGPVDTWVRWFADVARAAARQSAEMVDGVTAILSTWEHELYDLRSDAAAVRIIPFLPQSPVLTSATVAELLGTSDRAARAALDVLRQRGILEKVAVDRPARGRPATHYAATALLDATTNWAG
jgi:Fic family protein